MEAPCDAGFGTWVPNYDREPGYERALMIDGGGHVPKGQLLTEHYHVLHFSGGVEMYFASSWQEAWDKLHMGY